MHLVLLPVACLTPTLSSLSYHEQSLAFDWPLKSHTVSWEWTYLNRAVTRSVTGA